MMEGETCGFCLEGLLERHQVREYYRVKKGQVVMEKFPPTFAIDVASDITTRTWRNRCEN